MSRNERLGRVARFSILPIHTAGGTNNKSKKNVICFVLSSLISIFALQFCNQTKKNL